MAKAKKTKSNFPQHAIDTVELIQAHPAVLTNSAKIEKFLPDGSFWIKFDINVSLPSNAYKTGKSDTGVMSVEPVIFDFPLSYPYRAPKIYLRDSFNCHLPHINPIKVVNGKKYIPPCVVYGETNELMWSDQNGPHAIIDQLSEWLKHAASGCLINPEQGWEPMRRDESSHLVIYNIQKLLNSLNSAEGFKFFPGKYLETTTQSGKTVAVMIEDDSLKLTPKKILQLLKLQSSKENISPKPIYALLVWGENIASRYAPDFVSTLDELLEMGALLECKKSLGNGLNDLLLYINQSLQNVTGNIFCNILLIMCAKRPYKLIGGNSDLEFVPYFTALQLEQKCSPLTGKLTYEFNRKSSAEACRHHHKLDRTLLKKLSEGHQEVTDQSIIMIGCGSLGSKIALHLARSGYGPFTLIDNKIFSPHNTARHALTDDLRGCFGQSKTELLANAIGNTGQELCNEKPYDFIELAKDGWKFPSNTTLVVDSTGSMSVREYLSSLSVEENPGKIFHAALFGQGKVGLIAIEGPERNPTISDLSAKFWDAVIDHDEIRASLSDSTLARQFIGQGCDSYTMTMSDAKVSLFAASMAHKATQVLKSEESQYGEILIGQPDESQLGIKWVSLPQQPPCTIFNTSYNNQTWEIRIFQDVAEQIKAESESWKNIETGGVLMGKITPLRRCIIITRVVEAPEDSTRSENLFVLGTSGLRKKIMKLHEYSCKTLTYVGTWHSHPMGGEASRQDENTLEKLKKLRLGYPAVCLIWTPEGFNASIR